MPTAPMIKHIIVCDKIHEQFPDDPEALYLTPTDFIAYNIPARANISPRLKVINLCNNYNYLSKGYYVSLLAAAREMRCTPSVENIVTLNWKRHYQSSLPELNSILEKNFKEPPDEPLARTYTFYFGRTEIETLEPLARQIFDQFRFPLMRVGIRFGNAGKWIVDQIEPLSFSDIPKEKMDFFIEALKSFTGSAWRKRTQKNERYWIGILHDPTEANPPSNKKALAKFEKIAKEMDIFVEFLTKNDAAFLLEYDALFIRETTAINHHTYRFAYKAESEGMPCIDDTQSIIRCCNKVFQYELLRSKHIALPATMIIDRKFDKEADFDIEFPAVVKIPDGAFSRGVVKVDNAEQCRNAAQELLKKSDIVLLQEFVESEFDWRIGLIGGEPLFACKYYMAEGHWQIYNHNAKKPGDRIGFYETLPIKRVPDKVLKTAIKAAKLIGDGLYGVDLKQIGDHVIVMEVNDNPNIDAGIEDEILGDDLYRRILEYLIQKIER